MFHARIDEDDKKAILKSLLVADGTCRVVFCTLAFGMDVDVPNVRTVIHYGPSTDVDDYFQESGCAGRDGTPSEALIFHYPGCLLGHVTKKMKEYCKLTDDKCRRVELLSHFPSSATECIDIVPKHLCCDHCVTIDTKLESVLATSVIESIVDNCQYNFSVENSGFQQVCEISK